jgi:hypothetical protein
MDLREIVWKGVDWINLAQDKDKWQALVNTVMNFRIPLKAEITWVIGVTISFWRSTLLQCAS